MTATQVEQGRRIVDIACVRLQYTLAHRTDQILIDPRVEVGFAYGPVFPLDGFSPLQSTALSDVADEIETLSGIAAA